MTAIQDSSALRSVLTYLRDSKPSALIALHGSGRLMAYLQETAAAVEETSRAMTSEAHAETSPEEAEMMALQTMLTDEEEDPPLETVQAAMEIASRVGKMLDGEA